MTDCSVQPAADVDPFGFGFGFGFGSASASEGRCRAVETLRDTIEEKVMALQARKAELFAAVMDGGEFASAGLTAADIRELLGQASADQSSGPLAPGG